MVWNTGYINVIDMKNFVVARCVIINFAFIALVSFQDKTEYLSFAVSQLVYDLCGGVGDRPEIVGHLLPGSKRKIDGNGV